MSQTPNVSISVCGVRKVFAGPDGRGGVEALNDISLEIPDNSFVTLLGPSGCGKTTLLRMIAGIETPTRGEIVCKGRTITGTNTEVGYVPQGRGLFPWMTLRDNIELPLKVRRAPAVERRARSSEWITKVGLAGFEASFPWQLSGGMEKRGSIARALIANPDINLMDEPFGPLDAQTRLVLQDDLLRLWSERRNVVVFVTHDLVEAITLSDLIVVFTRRPGRIKSLIRVPIARPRNPFEIFHAANFNDIFDEVRDVLKSEIAIDR